MQTRLVDVHEVLIDGRAQVALNGAGAKAFGGVPDDDPDSEDAEEDADRDHVGAHDLLAQRAYGDPAEHADREEGGGRHHKAHRDDRRPFGYERVNVLRSGARRAARQERREPRFKRSKERRGAHH